MGFGKQKKKKKKEKAIFKIDGTFLPWKISSCKLDRDFFFSPRFVSSDSTNCFSFSVLSARLDGEIRENYTSFCLKIGLGDFDGGRTPCEI